MKKSLIALAVLAASGAAMAQSSVTLYGVLDTGLTYSKGDESVYGMTHVGGNVNSRLGFRGVEDLGNGLKATFNLEAGMGVDDGTDYFTGNGMAFRRTSTVGLEGGFGSVRLGRMLTSSYLAVNRYDAFGDTGIGASLAWNIPQTGYAPRTENAISYTSPNFSGFKIGAEYGFGEQQKASDKRYIGIGATYDNGPLSLGLGFDRLNGDTRNNTVGTENLTTWHLGAAYNFGVAKLMGFYKQSKDKDAGVGAAGDSVKFKTFGLGVTAPVGAAGEVRASYNHYRLSADVTGFSVPTFKANQLSLGYVHNLSKRTALYGTYAYLKNKNDSGVNMGLQLNGAMSGAGLSDSGAQHGLQVGVRHAF
ncbi:porin [Comamonas denitrificans]|uniref:Porin n=1 Tax=Comamonas denitrificans TaxID=117506 RepID=A0A939KC12_9BURK|nr:porin [Comamonas denitrificans]MBO1250112.1 porin [Comamonas denitrificans]